MRLTRVAATDIRQAAELSWGRGHMIAATLPGIGNSIYNILRNLSRDPVLFAKIFAFDRITGSDATSIRYDFAACSNPAMSNLVIFIMASMALGWRINARICAGTICQRDPNLSLSHPQAISLPPSVSFGQ